MTAEEIMKAYYAVSGTRLAGISWPNNVVTSGSSSASFGSLLVILSAPMDDNMPRLISSPEAFIDYAVSIGLATDLTNRELWYSWHENLAKPLLLRRMELGI